MARSFRTTQIAGITTARSDKPGKRKANRVLRAALRKALYRGDEVLPLLREVSDEYSMPKDGKSYFDIENDRDVRLMRK